MVLTFFKAACILLCCVCDQVVLITHQCFKYLLNCACTASKFVMFLTACTLSKWFGVGKRLEKGHNCSDHMMLYLEIKAGVLVFPKQPLLGVWMSITLLTISNDWLNDHPAYFFFPLFSFLQLLNCCFLNQKSFLFFSLSILSYILLHSVGGSGKWLSGWVSV